MKYLIEVHDAATHQVLSNCTAVAQQFAEEQDGMIPASYMLGMQSALGQASVAFMNQNPHQETEDLTTLVAIAIARLNLLRSFINASDE